MQCKMKYGHGELSLDLPDNHVQSVIKPCFPQIDDPWSLSVAAMQNPIASPALSQLVKERRPEQVAIVVNDHTRPTPYRFLLAALLRDLEEAGVNKTAITFVVATGAHRGNTGEEHARSLGPAVQGYRIINHDCRGELVYMGMLSNGCKLGVNPLVAGADMLILTGLIAPHELAGFSGGRKSILPGVAGMEAVSANHALLTTGGIGAGKLDGNPVHRIMMEAMGLVRPDFIINVVADSEHRPVQVVAGDPEKAWLAGVDLCRKAVQVSGEKQAEVGLASAGGYPRDINLYQAIKSMRNAAKLITEGGTLVICAQCAQGVGNAVLENWVAGAKNPRDITARLKKGFVLGGHKAYLLAELVEKISVILISSMPGHTVRNFFMTPAADFEEALKIVTRKHGDNYRAVVMPEAALIMPGI
ncbi:nickel-dependent lactate racemase [Desulfallas thermosapovorans]|uniref:Nickel-dependent lactate racemase n=1 Tax=Desulfallas thermosapovorans DSM 6562 TaxID=1121431 RepID=A0A5S4ZSM1_9FIRM|nr:nickel-dependent lactate racemase [Desulfallas thermosapovorans]TYO95946.1 nickel-dependent lactate racemase [Desulfallas thermosapovorans DSM 6562]